MNILTIGEAVTANENGAAIDLWAQTDLFGAGRGKELILIYAPTSNYDGTAKIQTAPTSAFAAATDTVTLTGGAVLVKKITPASRYIRRNTASRTAGSVSLYLLGAP